MYENSTNLEAGQLERRAAETKASLRRFESLESSR
jgi:hypothetical protein